MANSPTYQAFCRRVLARWATEAPIVQAFRDPATNYPNSAGAPPIGPMTYGLISGSGIQTNAVTQVTGPIPAKLPGWAVADLMFDVAGNVIVGFVVDPSWTDGTDGFWCLVSGGISDDKAHFAFRSLYDRGLDYQVTVYTISKQDWGV